MNAGMLWWIDTPKETLTSNIEKAVAYYRHKYGREPNLCLVNPSALKSVKAGDEAPQIVIRPYRPVLPGHLWIGVEEKS